MNSPLAIAATILWLLLLWLALRQCRRWAKARNKEQVIYQNHPAIPVKEYKLSDFETEPDSKSVNPKPLPRTVASQPPANVWDI